MESEFAGWVRGELVKARRHHRALNSLHEAYAILLEEMDELWDEVKKKRENRSPVDVLSELIQIGAMAQRAAEDLGLARRDTL